ncbi:hypothetical protein [Propionispora hippei]|jgi:hypothetical protein|uniref:Uncharacterized protein n=1 Tax=Propionispora hippei DSM 15287 TaxID=1123003 RepID=A0A1M6MF06_9FIRM|nr:hypothetical protein [Propionispora hippei]SHJ82054.1 hypothetical protein SAMN02745170_03412 [Propionispora hippei DSM 15287]
MEKIENIEEMMEQLEELLAPKLRIKLEIGFLGNVSGATTEIPVELLMQSKNPKALMAEILEEMHVGIMRQLKTELKKELAKMEE